MKMEIEIKNGKREGFYRSYYEDGKLKLEGQFSNNKETGVWSEYPFDFFWDIDYGSIIVKMITDKGYIKKVEVYGILLGKDSFNLIRELFLVEGVKSSLIYENEIKKVLDYNTICIRGLIDASGNFPKDLSDRNIKYSISHYKLGFKHGINAEIDALTENGVVKNISLFENGVKIKDTGKNRKNILQYFLNKDDISKEAKKMIEKDFKKYPIVVSREVKFLRGCFIWVIGILALLVFIITRISDL